MASGLLALPLALAGCGGSDTDTEPVSSGASSTSAAADPSTSAPVDPNALVYVALGDSYAAAPGVPDSDPTDSCYRSDHNYAHVVAESTDPTIALTDVTCSGATTDDVIELQVPEIPKDADLVTVGIGGNDFGLFSRVMGGCLALTAQDDGDSAQPCTDIATTQVTKVADQIRANMGKVMDAIIAAAPDAQVVVVGYPALLPDDGTTCPELFPLAPGDYPFVAGINKALSYGLMREAEKRDLTYLDVFTASQGHDLCSDDPWVNGVKVADDGTIPLHPFANEQAAVAAMITDLL